MRRKVSDASMWLTRSSWAVETHWRTIARTSSTCPGPDVRLTTRMSTSLKVAVSPRGDTTVMVDAP